MKIHIDPTEALPIVRQIVDQLRLLLVNGDLRPGDTLPPVRRVAMELHVHFNTVAEAYRQIAEEGWLELRHGRTATVCERHSGVAMESDWINFRARMRNLVAEMKARGLQPDRLASDMKALAEEIAQ